MASFNLQVLNENSNSDKLDNIGNNNTKIENIQSALSWQVGYDTDIGGGKENQDDYFVWQNYALGICVICVLDGHGREVGKIAAVAAKNSMIKFCQDNFMDLLNNPSNWLASAHEVAHNSIKTSFQTELTKQGYEVQEVPEGYLLKRKNSSYPWTCIHGGSSCSIVAIVGCHLYISNVGDSSATLCTNQSVLKRDMIKYIRDSAVNESSFLHANRNLILGSELKNISSNAGSDEVEPQEPSPLTSLTITSEHSPESVYEYVRLAEYRAREEDPEQPALFVVYDTPNCEKSKCQPVFDYGGAPAVVAGRRLPQLTGRGRYYKNVRKEWASLVATPRTARHQDALAFTRSLGDLHLHTYGVTHLPELQKVDISAILRAMPESVPDRFLCVVLASDGVWDNWLFEDVARFVTDPSCVTAVLASSDGAQRVAHSFMQRNALYAKRNFDDQADNATAVLLYVQLNPSPDASLVAESGHGHIARAGGFPAPPAAQPAV